MGLEFLPPKGGGKHGTAIIAEIIAHPSEIAVFCTAVFQPCFKNGDGVIGLDFQIGVDQFRSFIEVDHGFFHAKGVAGTGEQGHPHRTEHDCVIRVKLTLFLKIGEINIGHLRTEALLHFFNGLRAAQRARHSTAECFIRPEIIVHGVDLFSTRAKYQPTGVALQMVQNLLFVGETVMLLEITH